MDRLPTWAVRARSWIRPVTGLQHLLRPRSKIIVPSPAFLGLPGTLHWLASCCWAFLPHLPEPQPIHRGCFTCQAHSLFPCLPGKMTMPCGVCDQGAALSDGMSQNTGD